MASWAAKRRWDGPTLRVTTVGLMRLVVYSG